MSEILEKGRGKAVVFPKAYNEYFDLFYDDKGEVFLFAKEKDAAIEKKLSLCGYYVIVISHKMTAEKR